MRKQSVRPCVEELGSRTLPSAAPLTPTTPPTVVSAGVSHVNPLAGSITGAYAVGLGMPDVGTSYRLAGAGTVDLLGKVNALGLLRSTGFIMNGHAVGSLTLANAKGTITLRLTGPQQAAFATLPQQFQFTTTGGTGAYSRLSAQGTVTLKLNPLLMQPLWSSSVAPAPLIAGSFTLTIRPTVVTPPGDVRTGVDGVAMIGPISPVSQIGVPNTRPLPGAVITVQPAGGGAEIARVTADGQGHFVLHLKPGTYLLVPLPPTAGAPFPRGIPQTITVPANGFVHVVADYDSGIR